MKNVKVFGTFITGNCELDADESVENMTFLNGALKSVVCNCSTHIENDVAFVFDGMSYYCRQCVVHFHDNGRLMVEKADRMVDAAYFVKHDPVVITEMISEAHKKYTAAKDAFTELLDKILEAKRIVASNEDLCEKLGSEINNLSILNAVNCKTNFRLMFVVVNRKVSFAGIAKESTKCDGCDQYIKTKIIIGKEGKNMCSDCCKESPEHDIACRLVEQAEFVSFNINYIYSLAGRNRDEHTKAKERTRLAQGLIEPGNIELNRLMIELRGHIQHLGKLRIILNAQ